MKSAEDHAHSQTLALDSLSQSLSLIQELMVCPLSCANLASEVLDMKTIHFLPNHEPNWPLAGLSFPFRTPRAGNPDGIVEGWLIRPLSVPTGRLAILAFSTILHVVDHFVLSSLPSRPGLLLSSTSTLSLPTLSRTRTSQAE
jgi:hypothetical protein